MKKLFLILLLGLSAYGVAACDACGCKLSGFSFGILPQYTSHFVGVRYTHAAFRADMDHNFLPDEYSNDTYNRMEIMGRYSITRKLIITATIPYMVNTMEGSEPSIRSSGLGDPMMLLFYNVLNNGENTKALWKHSLLIGVGTKFPVGDYKKEQDGELVNRNFQLGSGSFDYLASMNYTIRRKAFGINLESSFKLNSANNSDYKFGNQFNTSGYFFYIVQAEKFSILPYMGVFFESAEHHTDGLTVQQNTGGQATFATLGGQVYFGSFSFTAQYQTPLQQSFNSEQNAKIKGGDRFSLGLLFNFSTNKKPQETNLE